MAGVEQPLFVARDRCQYGVIDVTIYDEIFGWLRGGGGVCVYVYVCERAVVGLRQYTNLAIVLEENVRYLVEVEVVFRPAQTEQVVDVEFGLFEIFVVYFAVGEKFELFAFEYLFERDFALEQVYSHSEQKEYPHGDQVVIPRIFGVCSPLPCYIAYADAHDIVHHSELGDLFLAKHIGYDEYRHE